MEFFDSLEFDINGGFLREGSFFRIFAQRGGVRVIKRGLNRTFMVCVYCLVTGQELKGLLCINVLI